MDVRAAEDAESDHKLSAALGGIVGSIITALLMR
jgi:hypothetical protein